MSLTPLFEAGWIIASHALMAMAALGFGIWQMLGTKGSARHRLVGYVWVTLMTGTAFGSFWIHDIRLFGPFSPIHVLSVMVLINAPLAIVAARHGHIEKHRRYMQSLFLLALVTAGLFSLLPGRIMHGIVFGA
ncbi:MAG: DUF2306 domain-containing protein [Pseudomonadota bacterium]